MLKINLKKLALNPFIWIELVGLMLIIISFMILHLINYIIWHSGILLILLGFILNAVINKKEYSLKGVDETFKSACLIEVVAGMVYLTIFIIIDVGSITCIFYSEGFLCGSYSLIILPCILLGTYYLVDGIRKYMWWNKNSEAIKPPKNRQQTEIIWKET